MRFVLDTIKKGSHLTSEYAFYSLRSFINEDTVVRKNMIALISDSIDNGQWIMKNYFKLAILQCRFHKTNPLLNFGVN